MNQAAEIEVNRLPWNLVTCLRRSILIVYSLWCILALYLLPVRHHLLH